MIKWYEVSAADTVFRLAGMCITVRNCAWLPEDSLEAITLTYFMVR